MHVWIGRGVQNGRKIKVWSAEVFKTEGKYKFGAQEASNMQGKCWFGAQKRSKCNGNKDLDFRRALPCSAAFVFIWPEVVCLDAVVSCRILASGDQNSGLE